ncbi:hypothetical protein G7046_g3400 [Stylonectria norvegica]|nr:hypothetical protein G7046_g3400 [Stylonectria norvegica]
MHEFQESKYSSLSSRGAVPNIVSAVGRLPHDQQPAASNGASRGGTRRNGSSTGENSWHAQNLLPTTITARSRRRQQLIIHAYITVSTSLRSPQPLNRHLFRPSCRRFRSASRSSVPVPESVCDACQMRRRTLFTDLNAGGKGTPRRKVKRAPARSGADDKKLQQTLKKLNTQPIQAIEEVNMFKADGNVIHFAAPKVHAAVPANTFAIYGAGEDKELTDLVPGILNQLGPDSLASLRKLAESYQNMQKGEKGEDEDDIPDLVEGEDFESKVE